MLLTAPCLFSSDMFHTVKLGPAMLFLPCDANPLEDIGFPYVHCSSYDEDTEATGFLPYA